MYGRLHDEMIRDRLVVGLRDAKLSEKLQLDAELTLDKAVSQVRQAEAVKKQQAVIRSEGDSVPIGSIKKGSSRLSAKPVKPFSQSKVKSCSWCGKVPAHDRQKCPAKEAVCRKCQKKGHFQRVCRSAASVGTLHGGDSSSDESVETFLGAVGDSNWHVNIEVDGHTERFYIDTGAEVTVISDHTHQVFSNPKLTKSCRAQMGQSFRSVESSLEL